MALDDASYGLIRPSTEAVRKRMGDDRDATNPDQWKAAIDSYADRFALPRPAATADERRPGQGPRRALAPPPRPASPGHRRPPLRHRGVGEALAVGEPQLPRQPRRLPPRRHGRRRGPQGPRVRPARRRALQGLPERSAPLALLARAGRDRQRPRREGPTPLPRRGPLDRPRRRQGPAHRRARRRRRSR